MGDTARPRRDVLIGFEAVLLAIQPRRHTARGGACKERHPGSMAIASDHLETAKNPPLRGLHGQDWQPELAIYPAGEAE